MESSLDPHDEVRRLQDQVRKLELQNEQLRSRQLPKNGFDFDIKPNILPTRSDLDFYKNRLDQSSYNWDNDFLKPEELHWDTFDNEETWLYVPKNCSNTPKNLRKWLNQDVNNISNIELQSMRRRLLDKMADVEQGSRRNFIDSGTFTRPKKRITRPGLEVMGERPVFRNQVVETPLRRLMSKQLSEIIDDISMNYDYSLPSLNSPDLNVTFHKDAVNLNATFVKVSPEAKSVISPHSPVNSTFIMYDNDEMYSELKSTDSDRSSNSRKTKDPPLNTTCVIEGNNPLMSQTITQIKSPNLNYTFSNSENVRCHAGMGDNIADDDQLSSASDSSFSSNTRLMNVGDVQTLARLQEENLKQVTSTPKRNNRGDGVLTHPDEHISPIKRNTTELHQGYLSDHSDHSSVDGRPKSSVRSSPSCSPYGSTNALAYDYHRPSSGVQRRETPAPLSLKPDVFTSKASTKVTTAGQRRVTSGLRPPATRSSIARPSTAGSSNIPRPASRIPAPRVRSAYTAQQPTHKPDWMDGCY